MAPEIPVTAHNRVCLGLPPNFNQQLDLHRIFASEITHGSLGDTVDSRRWQEIYIVSFQLAGVEGEGGVFQEGRGLVGNCNAWCP